jgi:hypothetical protein
MKIEFWKAMLNAIVIVGGGALVMDEYTNFWVDIGAFVIGSLMLGSGVRWMIEDIEVK